VTTAAPGGGGHEPGGPCESLRQKIHELLYRDKRGAGNEGGTHGLIHRFKEQIGGANGPGTEKWRTHENAIKTQQRGLRDRLEEWDKNDCGDPPTQAWHWATRPPPKPSEWTGGQGVLTAKNVATGVAAAGTGYLIYRGIRMLPSLVFPPLWPTAPLNAAIP
jgi:hypothetical protein